MKKFIKMSLMAFMAMTLLAGCGNSSANYKQAGLGGLVMMYDDTVWTPDEAGATDSSLRFEATENDVLGVSCAKEGMYQHPLDMIAMTKQIYSTYEGYQEITEPKKVEVNDESWYEWSFQYTEGDEVIKYLQRYYGKNYYAYTMSYVSDEAGFGKYKDEALKVMNSVVMSVPDNEEAEAKAKEFLIGEWDMGAAGYLVINQDGTYAWYMENTKDEANMHSGTYGCDVKNDALGFAEGQGVYLVLFPEKLVVEGKEGMTGSVKYDYGISMNINTDGSYPMINATTFNMYQLMKQ